MEPTLHTIVQKHLQNHYPGLPPLTGEQLRLFDLLASDGFAGRGVRVLFDPNLWQMLYVTGSENLLIPKEKWTMDVFFSLIPGAYREVYSRIAAATYALVFKHCLARHGMNLNVQSNLPIADAVGNIYFTNSLSTGVVHDSSSNVVLTFTEIRFIDTWDFNLTWDFSLMPINFRPQVWCKGDRLINHENEIIRVAAEGFVEEKMSMKPEWLPVWYGLLKGLSIPDIAKETNIPLSTVKFYNIQIRKAFQKGFSANLKEARDWADYWNRQTEQKRIT